MWRQRSARQAHKPDNAVRKSAEHRFGWIERLGRLRFLLTILFCLLVGAQTLLYFNNLKCWFNVPANVERWALWMDADRQPQTHCSVATHDPADAVPCNLQENWSLVCGPLAPHRP